MAEAGEFNLLEGGGGGGGGESSQMNSIEHVRVEVGINPSFVYQSEDVIKPEVKYEITNMEEVSLPDQFVCDVASCAAVFYDEINYKIHKRLHEKNQCQLCEEEVVKAKLNYHMQKVHHVKTAFTREVIQDDDENDVEFIEEIDQESANKNIQLHQVPITDSNINSLSRSPSTSTSTDVQNLNETVIQEAQSQTYPSATATIIAQTASLIVPGNENIIPIIPRRKTKLTLVPERVLPFPSTNNIIETNMTLELLPKEAQIQNNSNSKEAFLEALNLRSISKSNMKENQNNLSQELQNITMNQKKIRPNRHLSIIDEMTLRNNRNCKRNDTEDNEPPSTFEILFGRATIPRNIHVSSEFEHIPRKRFPLPVVELEKPNLPPEEKAIVKDQLLDAIIKDDSVKPLKDFCFKLTRVDQDDMTPKERAIFNRDDGINIPQIPDNQYFIEIRSLSPKPKDTTVTGTTTNINSKMATQNLSNSAPKTSAIATKLEIINKKVAHDPNINQKMEMLKKQLPNSNKDKDNTTTGTATNTNSKLATLNISNSAPKTTTQQIDTFTATATKLEIINKKFAQNSNINQKNEMLKKSLPNSNKDKDTTGTATNTTSKMATQNKILNSAPKTTTQQMDTIASTATRLEILNKKIPQNPNIKQKNEILKKSLPKIHQKDADTNEKMETPKKCKRRTQTPVYNKKKMSKIGQDTLSNMSSPLSADKDKHSTKVNNVVKQKRSNETETDKDGSIIISSSSSSSSPISISVKSTQSAASTSNNNMNTRKSPRISSPSLRRKKVRKPKETDKEGSIIISSSSGSRPISISVKSTQSAPSTSNNINIRKSPRISPPLRVLRPKKVGKPKEIETDDEDLIIISSSSSSSRSSSPISISVKSTRSAAAASTSNISNNMNIRKSPRISSLPLRPEKVRKPKKMRMPSTSQKIEKVLAEGGEIFKCDEKRCTKKYATKQELKSHYFSVHKHHTFAYTKKRKRRRSNKSKSKSPSSSRNRNKLSPEEIEEIVLSSD